MEIKISGGGIKRIFSDSLCSRVSSIYEHTEKHRLDFSREEYMEVGELISKGRQGKHLGWHKDAWYLVIVNGTTKLDSKEFGILRSVRISRHYSPLTCEIHGNYPWCGYKDL